MRPGQGWTAVRKTTVFWTCAGEGLKRRSKCPFSVRKTCQGMYCPDYPDPLDPGRKLAAQGNFRNSRAVGRRLHSRRAKPSQADDRNTSCRLKPQSRAGESPTRGPTRDHASGHRGIGGLTALGAQWRQARLFAGPSPVPRDRRGRAASVPWPRSAAGPGQVGLSLLRSAGHSLPARSRPPAPERRRGGSGRGRRRPD